MKLDSEAMIERVARATHERLENRMFGTVRTPWEDVKTTQRAMFMRDAGATLEVIRAAVAEPS